jgi:hypothetical protein
MKKITLLFASLLCVAYIAVAQLKLYVYQNDGTRTEFVASTVDSIAFSTITDRPDQPDDPIKPVDPTNGHEYVDLGLPSGTKWASRNIGATAVGDYGNYYSWGETQTKQSYTWSTYTLGTDSTSLTKYNFHSKQGVVDNRLRLQLADDAANANWGGKWRMPTRAEWQELLENCSWAWGSQPASNGFFINGYLITGPSGNSIFLPASGYKQDKLVQQPGVDAFYATSEILRSYFPDEQVSFYINNSTKRLDTQYRQLGLPVRPVYDEKLSLEENTTLEADTVVVKNGDYYYAKLGLSSGAKWAIQNVGASTADEYGDYFAWGETESKETYDWSTYKWCNGSFDTQTKYCTYLDNGTVDKNIVLDLEDDAANAYWGGNWTMPTEKEQNELDNDCRWTWVTKCGVNGRKVTGPNGVAVFLPAAGSRYNSDLDKAGSYGYYWSSSLVTSGASPAYCLAFGSSNEDNYAHRYYGFSVRPVLRDVEFTFTVMFDGNGGEGTMPAIDGQHDDIVIIPASTFTRESYTLVGWNTKADGTGTKYKVGEWIALTENITLYAQWKLLSDYTWIDLGLPSGTMWATMNVGATSPEDYGDYFAWGETQPKANYSWSTYKWCNGSSTTQTKYCTSSAYGIVDNKTTLDLADDAANANWGGSWRMPTKAEQDELRNTNYTTWTWTTQNGVNGYKVTSKTNGNSIFLPAAGYRYDSYLYYPGSRGYYWSSSLNTYYSDNAYNLYFNSGNVYSSNGYRSYGRSVRPVLAK